MAAAIGAFYLGRWKLREPALEEAPRGSLLRQVKGPTVRFARLGRAAETSAQVGAGCVRRLVVREIAALEERVHEREPRGRPVAHGDRGRAVELDHRRRFGLEQ